MLDPKSLPVVVCHTGRSFRRERWRTGSATCTKAAISSRPVVTRSMKPSGTRTAAGRRGRRLVAGDPKYLVNGRFEGSDGWTVEGDKEAAHFGPDPDRNGEPGLVLGYPLETSYKTGGKETSVTVKADHRCSSRGRV